MKIAIRQFASEIHSWAIVGNNTARALLNLGHQIDMFSTNGIEHFPADLKPNLIGYVNENSTELHGHLPANDYDLSFAYTALKNSHYISHSNKNRFLMWSYEWSPFVPNGFAKHHINATKILAPSNSARNLFINEVNRIPANKVEVIPHGITLSDYANKEPYQTKSKAKTKVLINLAQPHLRKNISGAFKAFHKAFTASDDVVLIAKISKRKTKGQLDIDPLAILNGVRMGCKNPPNVEIIQEHIDNIAGLYAACDIVFSMSHAECFDMVGLETLAAGKINVCPREGGRLDFLSDTNALLIDGKMARAPLVEQYWQGNIRNQHFVPNIEDAAEKLRFAVANKEALTKQFSAASQDILKEYTWENAAKKIIALCQ